MHRKEAILALLDLEGFLSVEAIAKRFSISIATARRDVNSLADQGKLSRTHGGVITRNSRFPGVPSPEYLEEKRAIGKSMAHRILDRQTIFVDSGSTCLQVVRALGNHNLTVVTHDLHIALAASRNPHVNLVFIGGELLAGRTYMWGPSAIEQIERLRVNVAVFGASSVLDDGVYTNSSYSLEVQRKIRSIASEAYFVADSTKFGQESFYRILNFDQFTAGITDWRLDPFRAASFPIPLIRAQKESL